MGSTTPLLPSLPSPPSSSSSSRIPYWNINLPASLHVPICPPFLQSLSPKDLSIISTPDNLYTDLTWPQVRSIIASNRLELFQRRPSDLRRYLENNHLLRKKYGSVMDFVLTHRLGWEAPVKAKGSRPFENEGDVRVLWNDWPYGIDERIVHLVVWTKFELEEDPETGDLTEEAREGIEAFVRGRFCGGKSGLERDRVIWFKNWASLKSIHAVEHFHVMLFDPDSEFVREVTGGDRPLGRIEK